jgi:chemotaxis protein histidine kinase CheA
VYCWEEKIHRQLAFTKLFGLTFFIFALFEVTYAESGTKVECRATQKLSGAPPGKSDCLTAYKIGQTQVPGLGKKLAEEVESGDDYAIAISKSDSCRAIGFATIPKARTFFQFISPGTNPFNKQVAGRHLDRALGNCRSEGCECAIAIDNGKVINPDLLIKYENPSNTELAQIVSEEARLKAESEARAKEQERVLADNKAREQARLIEEARARDEQRLFEEARVQQRLKLAEEARVKAESEARARDQERVLAENKAKEQARIIEEARAKDEQRRLEDARVQQQLKLAEEARVRAESEALAKEQERVLAESKAKERERQLAESKDAELSALRAQLEKMKQQSAKSSEAVQMAKRKALIIGNDSYKFISKLANAREDARAVAESLAKVGYAVTLKTDLTEKEMKAAIRTFKSQVEAGDEVAIFYAGHGIQLENTNYLIPIDVAGDAADQVKDEAIPLQRMLDDMADRKAKLTLALIDACRDNPFKSAGRSIGQGRGLAPTTAATGQMVVFSAGTGQQALDNLGPSDKEKNGIFTRVFIREMTKPDRTVDAVVRQVRNEVVRIAKSVGHEQVPAIYDQVVGEFYFARSGQ